MGIKPLVVAARYKLLLLVPFLIILPIAALASFMSIKKEYTSTARLLAQDSTIVDLIGSKDNQATSPAENRASDITELLATDSFKRKVAERIGMPVDTPADAEASLTEIFVATSASASGRHLLSVSHTSSDPERARNIVDGIVAEFRAQYSDSVTKNVSNATTVYKSQLASNKTALDQAEAEMTTYLGTRPTNVPLVNDPRYLTVQKNLDRAQKDYDTTQQRISDIQLQAQATIDGQDFTLSLKDAANVPTSPKAASQKKLLALPIAGLLLAMSVSTAIFAFMLRTDNSISTAEDLKMLPGLVLLGTVPDIGFVRRRRWPKSFFRVAIAGLGVTPQR